MKQRVLYLIETYALTVLIFIMAKVGFMVCHAGSHPFSVGDVLDVIGHGLSLDLSMALYIVCLPFLCTLASIWLPKGVVWKPVLRTYYALISLAFALAFVADTSLYEFWQFKLDASCLQYLETPTEAMASVSVGYLLVRLLVVIVLTVALTWCYWSLKEPWRERRDMKSVGWKLRLAETLLGVVMIPLIVIGIRGGLSESTTNIGQVYYSQNQFLNHSAVNPVFSFLASFEKTASVNTVYHFMDDDKCRQIIDELYNTQSVGCDSLLTTHTPNIIVILLEGCGGEFTEIGGRQDITPNLNQLAHEGVYFTNCYGNTWRTDRGTVCVLSGYPSFPTMSVMKIPSKSRTLPNIARSLKRERGYHTHYLYGGDINFTNMRSYLVAGGFEQLTWKEHYTQDEQHSAQWGVRDDITFNTLYNLATTMQQPYLIGFSTLSSHEPWDVPVKQFDNEILNAFYYLDRCLGDFIERFRKTEAWRNTLIVLVPDHGIPYEHINEQHPLLNHIPIVWVGGAVKAAHRITPVCNQTDLAATLLGQLGMNHDEFTFSRDVLSDTYTQPFAVNTYTEGFSVTDSATFVNYDLNSSRVMVEQGPNGVLLMERCRALLQAASQDLEKR